MADGTCAKHEDTLLNAALFVELFSLGDPDINGRQGRFLETTAQGTSLLIEFSDGSTFEENIENLVTAEATTAKLYAAGAYINDILDGGDSYRKKIDVWIERLFQTIQPGPTTPRRHQQSIRPRHRH